jgi:ParB/RepB/Spo0J family partition protein
MAKANYTAATTAQTAAETTEATEPTVTDVRVEQVDPAALLVDVNVRTETVADKDFVASVMDLGILQPIRAVRTADGTLRVETGHRRTLAAIAAGLATVPVLVVADERTDDAGTVERIVRQYAENEHRTGLTTVDRLGVVEQLSLLNVSAAQIAKRTRMKRPEVDQALAVTRSDLAKAASVRYDPDLGPGGRCCGVRGRHRDREGAGRGREVRAVRPCAGARAAVPRRCCSACPGRGRVGRDRCAGDRGTGMG